MKMHKSLVERIMRVYDMWGGRSDDTRLRQALMALDISSYKQQTGGEVAVLTEDLKNEQAVLAQRARPYVK